MQNTPEGQTIEENDVFQKLIHKKPGAQPLEEAPHESRRLIEMLELEHDQVMFLFTVDVPNSNIG